MAQWPTTIRIGAEDLKLLVTSPRGDDQMKARLPLRSPHPRALLTLLESLALFSGEPLVVVISADSRRDDGLALETWADDFWPAESPLVRFEFAIPRPGVRRTLRGVGDFRSVRRPLRGVGSR
jgi:hypothetical protein